ncbi:hypothetical protein Cgig2_016203 [Carnegiea gigantea]|uniref:Transmembrane protein n=1 Tax=Carnegiea gigantea TaxID=171969 RepID=A0A9Q1GVG8_9CARY|nr:hypothetical protein Cgig2_016203 [Carnegiea gigantea]
MSIASLQQSFLRNPLTIPTQKPNPRISNALTIISCKYSKIDHHENHNDTSRKVEKELAKLAIVTLPAGVLTLGSVADRALAAPSGGRVGGQAFRSSEPRSSSPRVNSRTNIYINPPVAPPLVGGYGFGFGVPFWGGWGWSPFSFFVPGPSVAIGISGGVELVVFFAIVGAIAAVIRFFRGSRNEDDEY